MQVLIPATIPTFCVHNFFFSPIDPQETSYCVVASHRRNYTSLCAAQHDIKFSRYEKNRMIESERILSVESSTEVDNKIEVDDGSSLFEGSLKNVFRRKKIGKRYFRRMSVL